MGVWTNQIWVTCALSDGDVRNSLVLANSLRLSSTCRRIGVIASPSISVNLRERLNQVFDFCFILEEDRNTVKLKVEDFVKIYALTLHSFETICFLNPNMIVVQNSDDIFNIVTASKSQHVFCGDNMDTSVVILKPSLTIFQELMAVFQGQNGTSVENMLEKWIASKTDKPIHIYSKFYLKLSFDEDGIQLLGNEKDISIVHVLGISERSVSELQKDEQKLIGRILDKMTLNYWLDIYNRSVKRMLFPTEECDDNPIVDFKFKTEPIAIVGMSCRYPGSNNLDEFWNLLITGEDGIGHPPSFRWSKDQLDGNVVDFREMRAGFLKVPVDEFDAKFFGLSPKEVMFMDPQHRILLEVIWEGLEDASIDPSKLRGSSTGVFVGSWTNAYKQKLEQTENSEFYRIYMGNSIGAAAARISFLLGLTGPSIATESGCSSGMVAVHLACKSLQNGESNVTLACGVNLLLHAFTQRDLPTFLAEDGHCKTFDAKADGFSRAEGCGVLVLKRLSDALKDNDNIWALVRGSAMTQEGISSSMGTPTIDCEALAMELALQNAHVEPSQVSYVETHGTGTVVGDPMEIAAIAKAYSGNRREPLLIGSVKTNVGHTESCSGITGIMKVVLAMRNEIIPAHRNFETLNPLIDLDEVPARIPLEPVPWPKDSQRRRISGVSSFGITGTDSHVIIEEPPTRLDKQGLKWLKLDLERPLHILKLSAKTEEALESLVTRFDECLESTKDSFADICYTANSGRVNYSYRCCIISSAAEECSSLLKQNAFTRQACPEERGKTKICFLFTGQGSQYRGMGLKLYETSPIFRMHFDHCSNILIKNYGIDIKNVLWRPTSDNNGKGEMSRTIYSQTGIFCLEYALLRLWQSWGVNPDLVVGHSLGEFCAAVCAGILTTEDALRLVAERSQLIESLPHGKMLVVKADKSTVDSAMKCFSGGNLGKLLNCAAINSPQQTVVSGDSEVVMEFAKHCSENNIKTIGLDSTHAFHSKQMDPILEKYRSVAKTVAPARKTRCEYISGMRGRLVCHSEVDPNYWVEHTREKVDFLNASRQCVELGTAIFIEIGPQPVLSALTVLNNDADLLCVPSLKRNENEWTTMLLSLEKLYLSGGVEINWEGFDQFYTRNKVRLPTYPFMGKKYWPDFVAAAGETIHPLLGSVIPNASSTKIFQCALNLRKLKFIKDHCVGNHCIVPGAAYLEMCLAAGQATVESCLETFSFPSRPLKLENLRIEAPLCLEETKSCQCQVVVDFNGSADGDGRTGWNDLAVKIYHKLEQDCGEIGDNKMQSDKWLLHSVGTFTPHVALNEMDLSFDFDGFEEFIQLANVNEDLSRHFYTTLESIGLNVGPTFRSLENIWKNGESFVAKVKVPQDFGEYIIHPAILDAMIQSVMMRHTEERSKKLHLPIRIGKFLWFSKVTNPDKVYIQVSQECSSKTSVLLINRGEARVLAKMEDIELIDTTLKAVEAILEQQTMCMPDLWEETWRRQKGPMERRVHLEKCLGKEFYTEEFLSEHMSNFAKLPADKSAVFSLLEKYTYFNMLKCLYELGWEPEENGVEFTSEELVIMFRINSQFSKFLNFFLKTLQVEGVLRREEQQHNLSSWKVIRMLPSYSEVCGQLSSPVFTNELVANFEGTELLQKIGENLAEIMKGNRSALQLLFPDSQAYQFYESYANCFHTMDAFCAIAGARVQHWLNSMEGAHDTPLLRILEVGTGTGLVTKEIFKMMDEVGMHFEYTFTDISAGFFPAAEKSFEKYKKQLRFKKLNIEEDPMSQGFIPEYYDYIVAGHVIHETRDIRQSLGNVMKLLRPGGSFDLIEQVKVNRIMTYTFGLMENFWKFDEDSQLRSDHRTMSLEGWKRVLNETGYEMDRVFPYLNEHHATISVNRPASLTPTWICKSNQIWILFWCEAEERLCAFLKEHLELAQRQVVTVCSSKPSFERKEERRTHYEIKEDSREDFEKLMNFVVTNENASVEGVIYTWSLDKRRTSQNQLLQPYFYLCQSVLAFKQKRIPKMVCLTGGIAPLPPTGVTSHFNSSTLWGFTKSLKNEQSELNCRCIDVPDLEKSSETSLREIFYEIWRNDQDVLVAYKQGYRYVPRFQPHKPMMKELSLPAGTGRFQMLHPESKSLTDLKFGVLDADHLLDYKVEIQVKASALNFKDLLNILKPTDEFKDSNGVGLDFAGVVSRMGRKVTRWNVGDAVFGVNVNEDALPSHIEILEDAIIHIPSNLTFCEAATLPIVFFTAFHSLVDIANMKQGEWALIHTASGGVGLCAIQLCKNFGVNVIATAGSQRKRAYLRSLGVEHIFHSRNTEYSDKILEVTRGRGVDIVLNSLTSEGFKEATLACCARNCRFLEMSKLSTWSDGEMRERRPDINYSKVFLKDLELSECRRLMTTLEKFLEDGKITPMPYVRFDAVQLQDALNYLQKAKHIGKVVCVMPEFKLENGKILATTPMFNDRSTYLVTGGLGGIGMEVAKWMLKSGAKYILLASRSKATPNAERIIKNELTLRGSQLIPVQLDVGNYDECKSLIEKVTNDGLPPLRGIMHAAGTLSDRLIVNHDWRSLSATFHSKISGTLNLHDLTANCRLEHFVLFSSVAALFGTPGQSNHAAGNFFEDTFAHYRHSIGLPATTVNWGQWGQVGVATEVDIPGIKAISTLQGIAALEYVLRTQRVHTCAMNVNSFVVFSKLSPSTAVYLDERVWKSANTVGGSSSTTTMKSDEFWKKYDSTQGDHEGKLELIREQVKIALRSILKLDEGEQIEDVGSFQEMGVDSLMFLELKNCLQVMFGERVALNINALSESINVNLLSEKLLSIIIVGDYGQEMIHNPPTFEQVLELLKEDCHLDGNIRATNREVLVKPVSEIRSILLTGATGTLGPYLLQELSNFDQISRIYCLIRPNKTETCEARLNKVLVSKGLLNLVIMSKVECVEGRIEEPNLGLDESTWKKLVKDVDAVFHSAAKIDQVQFYKRQESASQVDVRSVNILGTKNVLRFCCEDQENIKHVYSASSLLSVTTVDEDGTFSERWPKEEDLEIVAGIHPLAYPISKFVGDFLMKTAMLRGIPCKVFRFPFITGDSVEGRFTLEQNHLMLRYLFILKCGKMPDNPWPIISLPVDICAKVSTKLFFDERVDPSDIFNLTHPEPNEDQEFISLAKKFGKDVELLGFKEYVKLLKEDKDNNGGFAVFKDMYEDEDMLMATYANVPALKKWLEGGVESFWSSKKMMHLLPHFYGSLEPTLIYLERDLIYAKKQGWL